MAMVHATQPLALLRRCEGRRRLDRRQRGCQATAKTGPALCIINCYLQLVSRQDWPFPLSPTPFLLIAATPATALFWLYAIP